jgi:tRNA U34 5-carboxymethylaminomethyl modifying enzyme MnmG/GidA
MVLSMPHTTLESVLNIVNEQAQAQASSSQEECHDEPQYAEESKMPAPTFSIDPAAFDTVEATCKYDIYLQKQEDEMNRYSNLCFFCNGLLIFIVVLLLSFL